MEHVNLPVINARSTRMYRPTMKEPMLRLATVSICDAQV
jgi:hypothetical protein